MRSFRTKTIRVPLPDLGENWWAWPSWRLRDGVLWMAGPEGIVAVDLADARVLWSQQWREQKRGREPDGRPVGAFEPPIWVDETRVVMIEEAPGGLFIRAFNRASGSPIWSRCLEKPPEAELTEKEAAWKGADREEMAATLATTDEALAVIVVRRSRATMHWGDTTTVDWVPERRVQTEAYRLDAATGKSMWHRTFDDVYVDIVQIMDFTGLHLRGGGVYDLDWSTGNAVELAAFPGVLSWPRRIRGDVCIANYHQGEIRAAVLERGREARVGPGWKRPRVKEPGIGDAGDEIFIYPSGQGVIALDPDLRPRWERRLPGSGGAVAIVESPYVAVAGKSILGLDRRTGETIAEFKTKGGGVLGPDPLGESGLFVAACADGLAVTDGRKFKLATTEDVRSHLTVVDRMSFVSLGEEGRELVIVRFEM